MSGGWMSVAHMKDDKLFLGGYWLASLDRLLQKLEMVGAVIGGVMIFASMWVCVLEIFMRKLFNSPLYGQLDLIELSMVTYAILPISYCYRMAGHIRVDIAVGHLKGRRKWLAEWVASATALALIVALLPGALHYFQNAYSIGDSTINTQWPTWPSKIFAVIGLGILSVRIVLDLWAYGRLIVRPEAEPVAVPSTDHFNRDE
jgi:C4-dicarboxylate transporter DctQ subunit